MKKQRQRELVLWVHYIMFALSLWISGYLFGVEEIRSFNLGGMIEVAKKNVNNDAAVILALLIAISVSIIYPFIQYIKYYLREKEAERKKVIIKGAAFAIAFGLIGPILIYPVKYIIQGAFWGLFILYIPIGLFWSWFQKNA